MPGVAFVAHCLLNQNSKTDGGARCPGIYSPLVEELRERGWRIEQMPCPELGFTGLHRFWVVKEQPDTLRLPPPLPATWRSPSPAPSRRTSSRGNEVVVIGLEGSPSMGVRITSSNPSAAAGRMAGDSTSCRPGPASSARS